MWLYSVLGDGEMICGVRMIVQTKVEVLRRSGQTRSLKVVDTLGRPERVETIRHHRSRDQHRLHLLGES